MIPVYQLQQACAFYHWATSWGGTAE